MTQLTSFHKQAAQLGIQKAMSDCFDQTHFSICGLWKASEILGIHLDRTSADYLALHALHCVHWNTMSKYMISQTKATVYRMLEMQVPDLPIVEEVGDCYISSGLTPLKEHWTESRLYSSLN